MVETNDSKKKKVKVRYTDHTGQDVILHFPSHEAAFIGIKKDLENCKKKFFPDGNFAVQESYEKTELWSTEGNASCMWEYAGVEN